MGLNSWVYRIIGYFCQRSYKYCQERDSGPNFTLASPSLVSPLTGPGGVYDFGYTENAAPTPFYFSSSNIVANSSILKIKNYNEPTQGHLAATAKQGCVVQE